MNNSALDVKNYIQDGFVKICDVVLMTDGSWRYRNINETYMYKQHDSWVYFIVVDDEIVKVGETGNPLGIKSNNFYQNFPVQPITGTKSRFGRYRKGDGTDEYIRNALKQETISGRVSLWAKECPLVETSITMQGENHNTKVSMHKHLEIDIMKFMLNQGCWPKLNKSLK